jgi:hypothetical protein
MTNSYRLITRLRSPRDGAKLRRPALGESEDAAVQ